jgi:hypothetical protein
VACKRAIIGILVFIAFVASAFAQEPVRDVTINKRPFVDLGVHINELIEQKRLDLDTPFLVVASGALDQNGKIKRSTFKFIKMEGPSPTMLDVVKSTITALIDSGYLQYLSTLGVSEIRIRAEQDSNEFSFSLESQLANESRPKTIATLVNSLIEMKKREKVGTEETQAQKDDLLLLQGATALANGKMWSFGLHIPKAEFQDLLGRKLAEQKTTRQN